MIHGSIAFILVERCFSVFRLFGLKCQTSLRVFQELLAVEEEEDDKKALGSGGGDRGRVSGARAESSSEEGSEYEDMSSSDDDGPSRLKPVFISK